MKVLHWSTWQEICGIATYTANLVKALEAAGLHNEVYPINRPLKRYMCQAELRQDLAQFCRQARAFDAVHVQHEFSFFDNGDCRLERSIDHFNYLLQQLTRGNVPTIVTFHTDLEWILPHALSGQHPLQRRVQAQRFRKAWRKKVGCYFQEDGRLCQALVHSKNTRLTLLDCGFAPASITTMPHGQLHRDPSCLGTARAVAKARLGYPQNSVVLSLFGFVATYKGPHLAAAALRHLPPEYHLAIVGGQHPQESSDRVLNQILGLMAQNPDLKRRIRITGFLPALLVDLYHAATDVCLAPYDDIKISASGALSWALSSGKPVVASKIGAFSEINDMADCLLLFTDGCDYELAWHIERLMADPALQKTLVDNASAYVKEHSWPNTARETIGLYERAIHGSRARPLSGPSTAAPGAISHHAKAA